MPSGNRGRVQALAYDPAMAARLLPRRGLLTFAILVVVGRGRRSRADGHVDRLLHVEPLARSGASYYPFLLVAVKIVGALALAALARARGARLGRRRRRRAAADRTRARRPSRAAPAPRPFAARLARVVRVDVVRLSRAHGHRGDRGRALAALLAVAAHLCAADLRRPRRRRRARSGASPAGSTRSRTTPSARSRAHAGSSPQHFASARAHAARRRRRRLRAAASGSRSSRGLLRCPPNPRTTPRARGRRRRTRPGGENGTLDRTTPVRGAVAYAGRARLVSLLGPSVAAGGVIWAILQPRAHHPPAPARPGLLVARDRAAAPRRRSRGSSSRSSSRGRCSPIWRRAMQPHAEMVHWLFATGILFVGLCLLCEAIVGPEVWRMRAWRRYLWPARVRARASCSGR